MEARSDDKFIRLVHKDFSRLHDLELSSEYLNKVAEISEYNDLIADYYLKLSQDNDMFMRDQYERIAENVSKCHKIFFSESYARIKTKDIISIPLCKNRFCANCQKILQSKRINKFKPFIDKAIGDGLNLYHMVFTVRNPTAETLSLEYAAMQKGFALLIRYLSGNASLAGFPVKSWGFVSAIRAIEITYNEKGEYHPHYHCIFAFRKNSFDEKTDENRFSWHDGRLTRYFSQNEIILQKLWRACVDIARCKIRYAWRMEFAPYEMKFKPYPGVKLSKHRLARILNGLDYGYSVTADKIDEKNVYEVFKYACKFTSDDKRFIRYEQFKNLQMLLHKKRCVQCFGDWYNAEIENDLNEITEEDEKLVYKEIRDWLRTLDTPEYTMDSPKQLAIDIAHEGLRVIYRGKLRGHLNEIMTKLDRDGQMSIDDFFNIFKFQDNENTEE